MNWLLLAGSSAALATSFANALNARRLRRKVEAMFAGEDA